MRYVKLGSSGLKISELGLGTMTFGNQADRQTAFAIMDKAFEAGVNLFDCADVYPLGGGMEKAGTTERIVGEWLKDHRRDELIITSKCFARVGDPVNSAGLSRTHILSAIDDSLLRMQTDYIDLYMAHAFDPLVPIEESLRAFEDAARYGKIRYFGVSNWAAWQISKAIGLARINSYLPIISDELRYNLIFRRPESEIFPLCESEGLGVIAYNPLAGGLLTGRYHANAIAAERSRFDVSVGGELYHQRYWNNAVFRAVTDYTSWCNEWNVNPVTTAVQWVVTQKPISCVLIGASRVHQLDASLAASSVPAMQSEMVEKLDTLWYSLPRYRGENLH